MQEYLITAKVLGTGLSVILLLVGVMNFVNTMVVNVNTRRYELAVLESIGMTKILDFTSSSSPVLHLPE